jgi:hypothetical protein
MGRMMGAALALLSAAMRRCRGIFVYSDPPALRRVAVLHHAVRGARSGLGGAPTRKSFVLAAAMVAAAAASGAALSAIIPVGQDRFVEASAIAVAGNDLDVDDDQLVAAGFGSFDAEVDPLAVAISGANIAIAQGVANQSSSIGANAVAAEGEASLALTLPSSGAGSSAAAGGDTFFELLFMVDVVSSFVLSGSVDTQAIVTGGAGLPALVNTVILEDVSNASVLFAALTDDEAFSVSGLLNPGISYRLRASAGFDANQQSSNAQDRTVSGISSFALDLQLTPETVNDVPEPGALFLLLGGLAMLTLARRPRVCSPPTAGSSRGA